MPGDPVILNTQTGLVGMPTQEIGGIMARCLINPQIKIYTSVQIAQSLVQSAQIPNDIDAPPRQNQLPSVAADGAYKVLGISYEGDSRGNPWYMDLTCLSNATLATEKDAGLVPDNLTQAYGYAQTLGLQP